MANWKDIEKLSIFDQDNFFQRRSIDIDEDFIYNGKGPLIAKLKSSKQRVFFPSKYEPDFDLVGKTAMATVDGKLEIDGEIERVNKAQNGTFTRCVVK